MIISIVDFPNRNHENVVNEFKDRGITVLKGTINELLNQTQELKKQDQNSLIIWDYPTIIEDGHWQHSDALLRIVYFHQALTREENKLDVQREIDGLNLYNIAPPCHVRDTSSSQFEMRETIMKNDLNYFINDWKAQQEKGVMTDLEMKTMAHHFIKKSGLTDLKLTLESNTNIHALARYLEWLHRMTLNPVHIRRTGNANGIHLPITIAHELGHAVDPELPSLNAKERQIEQQLREASTIKEIEQLMNEFEAITMKKENNAFDLCYQFLDNEFQKAKVEHHRKRNERGYQDEFKRKKARHLRKLKESQL